MLLDKLIIGEPWVCSFLLVLLWIHNSSVWDVSNWVALLVGFEQSKGDILKETVYMRVPRKKPLPT
jgi:hypothetical protein